MKVIKIAGALPIEQFYNRLTPRTSEIVKTAGNVMVNDVSRKMINITLKNIIKALEFEGIKYSVETEFIDPLVLEERKAKEAEIQREKFMETQAKVIETMERAVAKANEKSPEKKVDSTMIAKQKEVLEKLRAKGVTPVINNEAILKLERNSNKIVCEIQIEIENILAEQPGAFKQLNQIFNEATTRFFNDVKIERKEKEPAPEIAHAGVEEDVIDPIF